MFNFSLIAMGTAQLYSFQLNSDGRCSLTPNARHKNISIAVIIGSKIVFIREHFHKVLSGK